MTQKILIEATGGSFAGMVEKPEDTFSITFQNPEGRDKQFYVKLLENGIEVIAGSGLVKTLPGTNGAKILFK